MDEFSGVYETLFKRKLYILSQSVGVFQSLSAQSEKTKQFLHVPFIHTLGWGGGVEGRGLLLDLYTEVWGGGGGAVDSHSKKDTPTSIPTPTTYQ